MPGISSSKTSVPFWKLILGGVIPPVIPANALLNDDGSPILNDDGSYILTSG